MNHDQLTSNGWERQPDGNYSKHNPIRPIPVPVVRPIPLAIVEQAVSHEPMGPNPRKEANANRLLVRITSFRRRLIDPDNLCPKYLIDCLRFAKIIKNDRAADIELVTTQRKIDRKTEETTEILITEI